MHYFFEEGLHPQWVDFVEFARDENGDHSKSMEILRLVLSEFDHIVTALIPRRTGPLGALPKIA